jgi:ABC-type nitrate/sulfonate/bicarbonate transport system permease component
MLAPADPSPRATATVRAIQVAVVVAFLGAWIGLTATHAVNPIFLPALPAIGSALAHLVTTGAFWRAAGITTVTVIEAFAIAAIGGIATGFAVGRSPVLIAAYRPVLAGIFAIPIILVFPLFAVMLGIGPGSKVAFGALYGFFPIAINTVAGFAGIDPLFVRSARSLGASRMQLLRHVYLPGAWPVVLSGLRIGFFITFASVLGGETLSSAAGVGHAIAEQAELLASAPMYAWIVVVLGVTAILNLAVATVERRASRH